MWHFHITIFAVLNSDRQKSTFAISEVVSFPALFYHVVVDEIFFLSCGVNLLIMVVEIIPVSNIIQKLLNFDFPLRVFIQPFIIGK